MVSTTSMVLCASILWTFSSGFTWPNRAWNEVVKARRFPGVVPWLGVEVKCAGCPAHSCEDDAAVIHGYCCGCALWADKLPIACPTFLDCPLNPRGLCRDYEYMLRCCC